jgi:hypothetical protein
MTAPSAPAFGGMSAVKLLAALAAVVVAVALLTPEEPGKSEGGRSSYSTGPGGVGMMFELAQRTGWPAERRLTPMDSVVRDTTVQVVIDPSVTLGAREVHRLLENVRRGGGLIFTIDAEEIAESLGVASGPPGRFISGYRDPECRDRQTLRDRALLAIPPEVHGLVWKKAPFGTTPIVTTDRRFGTAMPVASGFAMGKGRVAVVSTSAILANDAVGVCEWGADIAVARLLEYVRPEDRSRPRLVFDEFHHGFGMHGGSLTAVSRYLTRTPSGHFLAQALIAGLLLLFALAPRPLPPRDPILIARRSPLDHADALGHAYADVGATRTAVRHLVSGLRRRVGRTVAVGSGADDAAFLDAVTVRDPLLRPSVDVLRRSLAEPVPAETLLEVSEALRAIERQLSMPPQRAP